MIVKLAYGSTPLTETKLLCVTQAATMYMYVYSMCTVCLIHAVPFLSLVWQVLQSCSSTHCWTIHSASSAVPFPVLFFFHGTVKKEKPALISYATCGSVQNSVLIKYYNRIKGKKSVKRNIFFCKHGYAILLTPTATKGNLLLSTFEQ